MDSINFQGTHSGTSKLLDVSNYNTIRFRGYVNNYTGFYPSGYVEISTDKTNWIRIYDYADNKNKRCDIKYDISQYNALYVKTYGNQANNCRVCYTSIALCNI